MASFKSSQGVSILLVALLVCQVFMVPSLARTQVVIGANKMVAEPQVTTTLFKIVVEVTTKHSFGF